MPSPAPAPQSLTDAYRALLQALPLEHVRLVANLLLALQRSTLKEMNALVAETAHAPAPSSKEVA